MSDAAAARRLLACLDLTDLSPACSDQSVDALCRRAAAAPGPVAAVCLWPQMVSRARGALRDTPVRIATVANFPTGDEEIERVLDGIGEALGDGADEIDLVLPYRALLRGDERPARELVTAARDVVDQGRTLKVILETGALGSAAMVEAAGELALAEGADFLKSSTGQGGTGATPSAAEAMLRVIRRAGRRAGLKMSGGIRTLAEAKRYLELAERTMGPDFIAPATFRIGSSTLYDELVRAIEAPTPESADDGA
jgi:deoxyribose-phosphate aldolase